MPLTIPHSFSPLREVRAALLQKSSADLPFPYVITLNSGFHNTNRDTMSFAVLLKDGDRVWARDWFEAHPPLDMNQAFDDLLLKIADSYRDMHMSLKAYRKSNLWA